MPVYSPGSGHYARCPSGLLLAWRPVALGAYAYQDIVSDSDWLASRLANTMRIVALNSVANTTVYMRVEPRLTATVYTSRIAYCLEKINDTPTGW